MAPTDPLPTESPKLLPSAFSFLAPGALVLLPALALAFAPGIKDEAYEWNQHLVTALSFAAAFESVLIVGCWRKGWPSTLAALATLAALVFATAGKLPGFSVMYELAGGLVALGYWHASRQARPSLLEVVVVGFCSALSFWAAAQLSWWRPFDVTLEDWTNKLIFLGVTALMVYWLSQLSSDAKHPGGRTRLNRCFDLLALTVFAAAAFRTNSLSGNASFAHHWSVYAEPADLLREGRVLLGEVPSQYGFLSTLVLAALPTDDSFTALYWLSSVLVWVSAGIVYFTLSSWLSDLSWKLGAALVTVAGVALLPGWAPELCGPMPFPSVGAMRFIWVHVLLGFLLWRHLAGRGKSANEPDWKAVWIGSGIWLTSVLWSVESAAYVTAAWFPAGALLAMNPVAANADRLTRHRALLAGIGRLLLIVSSMLAAAVVIVWSIYVFGLGRVPDWSAYWEYAAAFSEGFGALPIAPWGCVWVLVLLHASLLAAIVSLDPVRQRSATALIWAAWGTLWAVSTYYVSRSHPANITNLSPVLLVVTAVMVHALRAGSAHNLARPWIWLTVPSFVGAMLWLVFTNQSTLQAQISDFSVKPHVARYLPPLPTGLTEMIAECLARQPGRYAVVGHTQSEVIRFKPVPGQRVWLPLGSPPLFVPLPPQRRFAYLDIYQRDQGPGWFIAPTKRSESTLRWLFYYLNTRYTAKIQLVHKDWMAWYCVPNPDFPPSPAPKN